MTRFWRPIDARPAGILLVAFAMMAVAVIGSPLIGTTPISLGHVFDRSLPFDTNIDAQIFFVARLPRVVAAVLVGASLALSGVVFQALLRNPLAWWVTGFMGLQSSLAYILFKERLGRLQITGVVVIVIGVVALAVAS